MNKIKTVFQSDLIKDKKELEKQIELAYEKVKKFFGEKIPEIKIVVVSKREEFNLYTGRETKDWEVGYTDLKDGVVTIIIFSPESMETSTSHKTADFYPILVHEIVHVFSGYCLKFNYPKWLHEGIAGYVAEQYKNRIIDMNKMIPIMDLYSREEWNTNPKYNQAFAFTKFLFDKFGKEKMLQFMKKLGWNLEKNKFLDMFLEYFGTKIGEVFEEWRISLN